MVYVLLCGYLPYNIDNRETLPPNTNLQALFRVHFSEKSWQTISAAAKGLIKGLLEPSQTIRLNAEKVMQHPWVKNDVLRTPDMVLDSPQVLRRTLGKPQASPKITTARLSDRLESRAAQEAGKKRQQKDSNNVVNHSQIALELQLPHERV